MDEQSPVAATLLGPNVKRLMIHRMTVLMIPPGTAHPFRAGAEAILTPGSLAAYGKDALQWVKAALAVVKTAPDNPYGDDDEAIAGELLRRIEERKGHVST